MDAKDKLAYSEGIISIVVNLLLFVLKYWAGIVTGSLALMADAWHTLSDSASSVIVVGSVKLSSRKADKRHPFGHGRYQQIASIFIAFMLGIIAYEFLTEAITKFRDHESTTFGLFAIIATVASILCKEGLAQYAFRAYRKTGYETLKADGWHHRSDALSSVMVLIGILLGGKIWWIDSALGAIISLMLFYAVFEIIRQSIDKLLGESPDEHVIERVRKIIHDLTDESVNPHHFHIHTYGSHTELTFHIQLDGRMDIQKGHDLATEIEREIRENMNITATIHIEPFSTSDHPGH